MDEVASVLLLILYILFICHERKRFTVEIPLIVCIFLFYLCYSFYLAYNSPGAVVMDFLVQIRPFLTFFMVLQIAPFFSASQKKLLKRICLYIWPLFIPVGIYGFVNPSFFKSILEQEANYVSGIVCLSLVYLYCSNFTVKEGFTFLYMLTTGMMAMHSEFQGFYFLTIGILLYFQDVRVLKSRWKTGFALLIVFVLIVYILKSQVAGYLFPPDAGNGGPDFTARSILYCSAIEVLKDFIPFGSGLASFATELSGKYYSQIYVAYGLNAMEGFSPRNWLSVSGSYYPSLVQFGMSGILLYLFFWLHSASKMLVCFKRAEDLQWFVITLTTICFIFIANISDAFFSSNKGFFIMMFLGLLAGKYRKSVGKAVVNTGEESVETEEYRFVEKTVVPPEIPDLFRKIPDIPPVGKIEPVAVVNQPEYEEEEDEYDGDEDGEYDEDEAYGDGETDIPPVSPVGKVEPVAVVNQPEYEEEDDEYDGDEDGEYDEDEAYGDGETETSCPDEATEASALAISDMQQQEETEIIPETIGGNEDGENEPVKKEESDMAVSESNEEMLEIPLKDEDFKADFPTFEPLLDGADVESAQETTENRDIRKHSEPEKRNEEDYIREKPAATDEETNEDDVPIDYII
ncbi:MAG: hypothetical protein LBP50_06410 [Tannerella sp.]|nr:hypothetical protein [Tannerella sp.]